MIENFHLTAADPLWFFAIVWLRNFLEVAYEFSLVLIQFLQPCFAYGKLTLGWRSQPYSQAQRYNSFGYCSFSLEKFRNLSITPEYIGANLRLQFCAFRVDHSSVLLSNLLKHSSISGSKTGRNCESKEGRQKRPF
jgi:hypothetical protein